MRLFVAVRPPPEAVAHLRTVLPRWPSDPARWHLTLAFLGEVDDPEPLRATLAAAVASVPGFDLSLRGSGVFGGGRVVWVGVAGDVAALHTLASATARASRAAGVELDDAPYRPHLTVGRRGHPDPASLASYDGPSWLVREVELVRSDVGRTVVHTVLARLPLGLQLRPGRGPAPRCATALCFRRTVTP